jgi:hypothetical protein
MHTVPRSYLEAFSAPSPERRVASVWRFDRVSGEAKKVGVRDTEVVRDIYTVFRDDGTPDAGIEEVLCHAEGAFCNIRDRLRSRVQPRGEEWGGLARFVAAQLLRTPRSLQFMRDLLDDKGETYEPDSPQRAMLLLINLAARRLGRMRGMLAYNDSPFPLLTSDNPVATWRTTLEGVRCGIDLRVPDVVVSCPLAPEVIFTAYQTPESLDATMREEIGGKRTRGTNYQVNVLIGTLPTDEVKRLNSICVTNAHRYVYASYNDGALRNFLTNRFLGQRPGSRISF